VDIIDLDTGERRRVFDAAIHYAPGIWDKWLVVNQIGPFGDAILLCDLVAGGFMSEDRHVCPEWGCEPPDTDSETGSESDSDTGSDSASDSASDSGT